MLRYEELSLRRVKWLLDKVEVDNTRYDVAQFQKFYRDPTAIWLCQYCNGKPSALCVLKKDMPMQGYWFLNEVQAFISGHGYGKKMVQMLMQKYTSFWLVQRPGSGPSLNAFYKTVNGLKETKLKHKQLKCICSIFSQGCAKDVLLKSFS